MKSRLLALFLVMALFFTPVLFPVAAQSNHTLEWGADVGEEFIYVLQREHYSDPRNYGYMEEQLPFLADIVQGEKVILEIGSLETIENLISESAQLPRSYCNLKRFNDSALIMANLTNLIHPIGDWNFLTETHNVTSTAGITLIDNQDEWGTNVVGIITGGDGSSIDIRIEMRYEKVNGTLSYLRHRYSTLGTDIIDMVFVHWYPGMPTIFGGDMQLTTTLIFATIGLAGLIVAFLVYRGIKSKKTVAQRFGE